MRRITTLRCILLGVFLLHSAPWLWGQDQDRYIKTMNSLVPGTPEASALMKYIDFPVSLYTGTPNINIPLVEVKGNGISVPLSLSYVDGNGIPVNELAASTGLGFHLAAGGEISREVRGGPDENGIWLNSQPVSYYASLIEQSPTGTVGVAAAQGTTDLEPDMFYFSFCGRSGKFIYDETTHSFICTEYQPYKITHDGPSDSWTVIAPDGSKYVFTLKVKTTTNSACDFGSPGTTALPVTTSWKLTKIVNTDNTDSIALSYNYNTYNYVSEGSSIRYTLQNGSDQGAASRPDMNCFSHNNISGYDQINKITSSKDTVNFVYNTAERPDLPLEHALSQIVYTNGTDAAKQVIQLDYDYYQRSNTVGMYNEQTDLANKQSLRLLKITNFGNAVTNPNPLVWNFSYNSTYLPARLSYAQDFWGYPNTNTVNSTLVPADIEPGTNNLLVGANRTPDNGYTGAGILTQIKFPTGGTTSFGYEPNDVGYNVPLSNAQYVPVIIDTQFSIPSVANNTATTYHKTFTINEPADPVINYNNPNGGANVNVQFFPLPQKHPGATTVQYDDIYYDINNVPFIANQTQYYLPNNDSQIQTYTIKIDNSNYLNAAPYLPVVGDGGSPIDTATAMGEYILSYPTLYKNAYGISNRQCGGVRIKSVTTNDPYGNVTMQKQYSYHDPVTDSSYGNYFGATTHGNSEFYVHYQQIQSSDVYFDCINGVYLARHGNNIIPGSAGLNVVYPKVFEYTMEGTKQYVTEHNYSIQSPPFYSDVFPFVPPINDEAKHGKETSTIAYKNINNNSNQIAKSVTNNYNYDPTLITSPNTSFTKSINGIKVSYPGYAEHMPSCGFNYVYYNAYTVEIGRPNLVSDTTVTYDLNNQYLNVSEWHNYTYGDHNGLPVIEKTGNSDGSVTTQKNYYANDLPDNTNTDINNMPLSQLTAANIVSEPLGSEQYKDGELLSQSYFYGHFDGFNHYIKDSMRRALFSNPLDVELKVLAYDSYAEPLTIWLRGNKYRKYIWYAPKGLPLATCVSPQNDFFYFTSFEYTGDGGTAGTAFSGSNSYNLWENTLFLTSPTALNNEDVYVWATNGVPNVNGSAMAATGKTKGSWTLYTSHVSSGGTSLSLSGSATIDQLVVMPTGSQFQGVVYDAGNRIVATVNNQIETNFYQYDAFGRLSIVTDEQGNILKSDAYQYQTAQ